MKQLSRVLFMLTALVVTTTVPAQQVNPPLWQQAKKGDVSAQYSLSAILARGKSYIQSNYWLTQAAQRGDPRA